MNNDIKNTSTFTRILIIGGYGNFGSYIAKRLAANPQLRLIIAGRSLEKARTLANTLDAEAYCVDIEKDFPAALKHIQAHIVIHTSGPFQQQSYHVARTCIDQGVHYIDLADGREFVAGISTLDKAAKNAGVSVISGASSVPCLTAALLDDYQQQFEYIDSVDYGITTAQKTTRGLATTAAILSYTGKPFFTQVNQKKTAVYGWQDIRARKYAKLGWRLLGNCNVPDLELFPQRYPKIATFRFYAGIELPFIHVTLWGISWLVRWGLIKHLEKKAPLLLKLAFLFDRFGTADSAFHLTLTGQDRQNTPKKIHFELTAKNGDGPYIPCTPAILLCNKLAANTLTISGATPCIGLITKEEYLTALSELAISWEETQE